MIEEFRESNLFIIDNSDKISDSKNEVTLEEAINIANEILVNTRAKKEVVSKLLTTLYKIEVKL
jgi:cell division GTPase FtsZ